MKPTNRSADDVRKVKADKTPRTPQEIAAMEAENAVKNAPRLTDDGSDKEIYDKAYLSALERLGVKGR